VHLEIFSEKENVDKLDYAMESLKNSMKWDEDKVRRSETGAKRQQKHYTAFLHNK
jgi:aminopeptidase N